MGFIPQEKQSDNTIKSSKTNEKPIKSTMAVYEYQSRYGQLGKGNGVKTQQQMQTKLLAEQDKIYHDVENNQLILSNLKPIPKEKQKIGGADHTLDGHSIFKGIYGEKTNEEITRKKVARLVSPEKFAEIEQLPVNKRNAEVQKITHGRSLINTPVNVGFPGTEHIKPTSHDELKGRSNLSALNVKTGQMKNAAFINPQVKEQEQADISLTYNPKINHNEFNENDRPNMIDKKNDTPEFWSKSAKINNLNGGTLDGATPDGQSAGEYARQHMKIGEKYPDAGMHEFRHHTSFAIGNTGKPYLNSDNERVYPKIIMPGFDNAQEFHLAKLDESLNALGLFKDMMFMRYGISVTSAQQLKNFYEDFWKDEMTKEDSSQQIYVDKTTKDSIKAKLPPETRRLFELMDQSSNIELFYQFLDAHNIMNQVKVQDSKKSSIIPTWA